MPNRSRAKMNNSGVCITDEPFHKVRNQIICDLKGEWISSTYWHNFDDKDLLRAVITRMQSQGDLLCRSNGDIYEWFVVDSAEPMKIFLSTIPK